MARYNAGWYLREKKCKKCGKCFLPAPMHIYKVRQNYYCSWTCYLHRDDKEKNEDDKRTT